VFVSVWATAYLEFWKRKNSYLAWWWDVLDFEREETTRPEWYSTKLRISPITGKEERHYPDRVRYTKMTASAICIIIAVIFVLLAIMASVIYQVWSRDHFGHCDLSSPTLLQDCAGGNSDVDGTPPPPLLIF